MYCCAQCFGDRELRKEILPIFSEKTGTCSYCGTEQTYLVEPKLLVNYFELVMNIYQQDNQGYTLLEWLKADWGLFPSLDDSDAQLLLSDILGDREIVKKRFSPSALSKTDRLDAWEKLKIELMYNNRFFPKEKVDEDRLSSLLSHLILEPDEFSRKWYRARIQKTEEPYTSDNMGAPPYNLARQGGANPAGIPYLYLASDAETAISESRPHTGEYASVADFTLDDSLILIDLRNPRKTVSPFMLEDETLVALLRGDIEFLVKLGDELTRPVLSHSAAIDYIPSQFLCEFIKKSGYHGVVYRSSVGEGVNMALFYSDKAVVGSVKRYKVNRVTVFIEENQFSSNTTKV